MQKLAFGAGVAAILAVVATQGSAVAAGVQLSQDQCQAIWNKADSANAGSLTADQAAPYIADFTTANASGNGKLTPDEFLAACSKGLVHDSASSGSSSGASGGTAPAQ